LRPSSSQTTLFTFLLHSVFKPHQDEHEDARNVLAYMIVSQSLRDVQL